MAVLQLDEVGVGHRILGLLIDRQPGVLRQLIKNTANSQSRSVRIIECVVLAALKMSSHVHHLILLLLRPKRMLILTNDIKFLSVFGLLILL